MAKKYFSRPLVLTLSFVLLGFAVVTAQQNPQQELASKQGQQAQPATPQQPTPRPSRPATGNAQDPPITDKIATELVSLTVTVTDPYNRLVTGLDKQNFEIFEDKVKQDISHFSDDDVPVSL